jgi:hypothetical protein
MSGITKILLDTGESLFECDGCGRYGETDGYIRGHMAVHNVDRRLPMTSINVIKKVVSIGNKYKRTGNWRWATLTANELNELGVPTHKGQPWTGGSVHSLYKRWAKDERIKTVRTTTHREPTSLAPIRVTGSKARPVKLIDFTDKEHTNTIANITRQLDDLSEKLANLALSANDICKSLQKLPVAPSDYEMLKDKSTKYDQLSKLLRS